MSLSIVALSGNVTRPSRTASLTAAITSAFERRAIGTTTAFELVDVATDLFAALRPEQLTGRSREIVDTVEAADILVVASPVYRASYTGALKHLFDLVHFGALAGKPVILAATGGSQLHGLVTEHQLRPLMSFFNALTVPTAIYATEADFADHALINPAIFARIDRAVEEAVSLVGRKAVPVAADRLIA
jgi:FMN reductase